MKIGLNGQIMDAEKAVVSVYDHGFLYGLGCFETFRTYGGQPFLWEEHLQRLTQSCDQLGIAFSCDANQLQSHIHELLEANRLQDAYIRLSVSAGPEALGLPAGDYLEPTIVVYMKELPPLDNKVYAGDKSLQLLQLRRNTPEGAVRYKSFHYMNNILGKRECSTYPWAKGAEGLFLTADDHIAEGIVSNIFFVRDGRCYTPGLQTGILAGITRAFVLRMAESEQIPVEEGIYRLGDLCRADEIFVTNSVQEIVSVDQLFSPEGTVLWARECDERGPVTSRLHKRYCETAEGRT